MAKTSLPPGFRFHPTDVELVWYYLKKKIMGKPFRFEAITEVDLYKFCPWDLPGKSLLQSRDLEWYFFCPRDKKYSQGSRTNRATENGYWKTTGRDRVIIHNSQTIGMKKTLIFHLGKPPQGSRTDWVMYEFRLESKDMVNAGYVQDAYVLCKIFQKSGPGPKNGEQYGAPFNEDDWDDEDIIGIDSFLPFTSGENAQLPTCVPLLSVASEVGERSSIPNLDPSCVRSNYEVGEPSIVHEYSGNGGIGEMSCMQESSYLPEPPSNFEVGEPSFVHEYSGTGGIGETSYMHESSAFDPSGIGEPSTEFREPSHLPEHCFADGMSLGQLETFLNSSLPHSNIGNDMLFETAFPIDCVFPVPNPVPVSTYDDLVDIRVQPYQQPADGVTASEDVGLDHELHSALEEFANDQYVELTDIDLVDEGRPDELAATSEYNYPLIDNASLDLENIYLDNFTGAYVPYDPQLTCFAEDHFLPTMEDNLLPKDGG